MTSKPARSGPTRSGPTEPELNEAGPANAGPTKPEPANAGGTGPRRTEAEVTEVGVTEAEMIEVGATGPRPARSRPARAPHEARVMASAEELRYPAGSLVLLAGLPGAGKSTLLARLYGLRGDERKPVVAGDVRVVDSRQARNWWSRYLGPIPHRARTPLAHATHVWRITRAVLGGHPVIAHTRGTWPHILNGFAWLARRRGADMHLILLDVPPGTARAGQHSRGRVVTGVTFGRHCRRWGALIARARADGLPPAATVTVLDRAAADRLRDIRFDARSDPG